MRRSAYSCLGLFGTLLCASTAQCQTLDVTQSTGAPLTIYSGSNIDKVNTTSGDLRISIPLIHLPGRGLDTDIVLTYHSKIWVGAYGYDQYGNVSYFYDQIDPTGSQMPYEGSQSIFAGYGFGWGVGVPRMGKFSGTGQYCGRYYSDGDCISRVDYGVWMTEDGTRTPLINDNGVLTTYSEPDTGWWSNDGSYLRLRGGDGKTARYKDGTFAVNNGTNETLEDTNGNYITCQFAKYNVYDYFVPTSSCTDTLGRTINYNYDANGLLQKITYLDSSGTQQAITFLFQASTFNYPWASQNSLCLPGCTGTVQAQVLTSVTLPNGKSYSFQYTANSDGTTTGELSQVNLPTGGYIRYTYGWTNDNDNFTSPAPWMGQFRTVATRTVSSDGTAGSEKTWNYSIRFDNFPDSKVADPLGNIQSYSMYSPKGVVDQIQYMDSGGHILKTMSQPIIYDNSSYNDPGINPGTGNINNPRYASQTIILNDTNQQSQETYSYGSFGNLIKKSEYDWGAGAPGPLTRTTNYTYLQDQQSNYAGLTVHILDRKTSESVYDASGTLRGQTTINYDTSAPSSTSNIVQHDYTAFPASYNLRGNPTQTKRWRNTDGASLTTTNAFNDVGNLVQIIDPMGNVTSLSFADNFYNFSPSQLTSAFVTRITYPGTNGVNHIKRAQYYFYSGLPTARCGMNFPLAANCTFGLAPPEPDYVSYTYDSMSRPLATSYGDGGQVSFTYNESALPMSLVSQNKITGSINLISTTVYDGLGRQKQTQLNSDPDGIAYVDTTYDAVGRKACVSNPYRSTRDSTYGLTCYSYDALSRIVQVIPPDGSPSANNVTTTYSGNTVAVTDQAGKKHKRATDALGRLTTVWEDSTGFNYETDYQYNVLDNLTSVVQNGSRQRAFVYNSLAQLTSSTNPESNTVPATGATVATTYSYDNEGNLSQKTMPAQNQQSTTTVTLTYCYDALNRLTGKGYTAQTCTNGTMLSPVATYLYDQTSYNGLSITNGIGQRTGMSDTAGTEAWSYDPMGRPLVDRRTTNSVTKSTTYTYLPYVDGSLYQLTYPSGRTITYATGGAEQLLSAVDTPNSINYATAAHYAPQGALSSLTNGASLISTLYYNSRLQPCRISAESSGTVPANCTDTGNVGNVLDFTYNFSLGTADNGNVMGITNNRDTTRSQTFAYDTLNRLATAQTTSTYATSPAHCWGESFGYDAWANLLTIGVVSSSYNGCTEENLSISMNAQNRISTSGYVYDTAGNLTSTPNPGAVMAQYNAENQLTNANSAGYTYDGDGKRVQKSGGTLYWYGINSDALDETDLSGNISNEYIFFGGKRIARRDSSNNVFYYFTDHLGTSRVITTVTGIVCYDADFYPFGGERIAYTNACPQNYKFTGKERDSESGQDDFGYRYFGSSMGRFMSPDEALVDQRTGSPQSWNLYSYVRNNPLTYADSDGRTCIDINTHERIPQDNPYDCEKKGGQWIDPINTTVIVYGRGVSGGWGLLLPDLPDDTWTKVYNFLRSRGLYGCSTDDPCISIAEIPIGPPGELALAEINMSEARLTKVLQAHTEGGLLVDAEKSIFNADEDVEGLIRAAKASPKVVQEGGNFERIVDAGRNIGVDRNTGLQTSIYTVITDSKNNLITAFPGRP